MRIWGNDAGELLTDDQLLRYIATFGSLAGAAEHGDVRLVANRAPVRPAQGSPRIGSRPSPKLSDYLREGR